MDESVCPICRRPDGAGHLPSCLVRNPDPLSQRPISILREADALVNGDRHEAYGAAKDNFAHWRDMCRATGRDGLASISAEDLAVVMIYLKVCRNTVKYKRDSTVDGAAYFDLWDQVKGL